MSTDPAPGDTARAAPAPVSTGPCDPAELRALFLFEKLTDDQLAWLCREGRVEEYDEGPVYAEGDPAASFYVLISGTVVVSRQIGSDDIEVVRTSSAGVYGGAFQAYLGDRVTQVYNNSMRVTEQSRFYVLAAARFAELMTQWFPMAVHLLEGLFFGIRNTQEAIGQRERLLALGSLSAGLTHELNNPAAAAVRAARGLRERLVKLRHKLPEVAAGQHDEALLGVLVALIDEATPPGGRQESLAPLEAADAEDAVAGWLDDHGVTGSWQLAPVFVQAGIGAGQLEQVTGTAATPQDADRALHWLAESIDTELLLTEITDSVNRISALVGKARQYSQLDRAPYQVVDVAELLDSTLAMLKGKIGDGITIVRDYAPGLPRVPGYPGELNQVWTNIIDNAVAAMDGTGTLTIATAADRDQVIIDFGDTGPGVPPEIQPRIFEPFFTTKPVGQGTGLGLEISWRIVVKRHHGDLRVESVPGDTHFVVRLPVSTPAESASGT